MPALALKNAKHSDFMLNKWACLQTQNATKLEDPLISSVTDITPS